MFEKLIDQLIYAVEQRIAAALYLERVEKQTVEQDLQPYLWYVYEGVNKYAKYTAECLQEVPISYTSKRGFIVRFTPEDTVHTAFLKIVKSEYEIGVIDGVLELRDRDFQQDLRG